MRATQSLRHGFVLITAFIVSLVLLVVGLGFLGFTGNDYFFSGRLHNNTRAFYLAWAGMQYYTVQGMPAPDAQGRNTLQIDDPQHLCTVVQQDGNLTFCGQVTDGYGRILCERDLVAPGGNLALWYEATR